MTRIDFLSEQAEILHGEGYNKKIKLKGKQSVWVQRETRINMYKILEFIYNSDKVRGKKKKYYQEEVQKGAKLDYFSCRHALHILCSMQKNPIRTYAWNIFPKNKKVKPKKLQVYRLIVKL